MAWFLARFKVICPNEFKTLIGLIGCFEHSYQTILTWFQGPATFLFLPLMITQACSPADGTCFQLHLVASAPGYAS